MQAVAPVKPKPPHCSHALAVLVGVGDAGLAVDLTDVTGFADDLTGVAEGFTDVGRGFVELLVAFVDVGLAEGVEA